MFRVTSPFIALLLSGTVVLPALADDFFLPGMSPMEISQPFYARESARIWGLSLEAQRRSQSSAPSSGSKPVNRPSNSTSSGARIDLSYQPSAVVKQQIVREYVERIRRKNPTAAAQVADQLRQYDYDQIYTGIVQPFGLSGNNVADVFTAYLVLNWMIANQSSDPSRQAVMIERDRTAATLSKNSSLRDPQVRQKLGEEIKLLFVTLHSGWKTAQREGQLSEYSDGVAALFRQQSGADPRRIVLTSTGFEPRR